MNKKSKPRIGWRALAWALIMALMMTGGAISALAAPGPAALPQAADNSITWSIESGAEFAELNAQGVLTAKENGSVTVRATAGDGSGVYGEKTISISGQEDAGSDTDVRFGVISDTHVTATKTVQQQRLAKAFNFFSGNDAKTPIEPVDKMVVVGDLTDNGTQSEMNTWGNIRNANLSVPLQAGMGNHENNRWAEFEGATGNKANYVTKLNGYTFITVSPGSGSIDPNTGRATGSGTGSYAYAVSWLEQQLAQAEAESPDKPIFVFFHHPIRYTFYVSSEWYGSGFENVFKTHPRAVTFAGHIHSPNNISTSIWQDGGYTAVNTVSTSYFELERGMIYGSVPPNASQCAQGLLVEVSGSEVTIKNYDILADAWIDQTWTFDVSPDHRDMPYTQANLAPKAVAPVFPNDATITISNQKEQSSGITADIEFDQAKIPASHADTMGDIVHSYRYDFYETETGASAPSVSFTSWSDWYITPMPAKYKLPMSVENEQNKYLKPGTRYELRITAIDTFGKESAQPLTTEFTTLGTYTEKPKTPMNYAMYFNDNLNNSNFYPTKGVMHAGTAQYAEGVSGKAIDLGNESFVALEDAAANETIDYNTSFTMAFWMNIKSSKGGDPALVSNKNWNSGGNDGYIINLKDGRLRLNITPKNGSRHDIWMDPNAQTAKDTWAHIAFTANKATGEMTTYFNGVAVATETDNLSGGVPGNGKVTLLGNSFDSGDSIYNRTGGSYELNMLMDDFVLVDEAYSAQQIKALADGANIKRPLIRVRGEFPEIVYKNEAVSDFPSISTTVPNAKLAITVSTGSEVLYQNALTELIDEFDLNTYITPELFGSLPAGNYDIKVEARDAKAPALKLEEKAISVRIENVRTPQAVTASAILSGPAVITEGENADYTVSLADAKNIGTVRVDLSYGDNLELVGATAVGDKLSVLDARDNHNGTATVTLWANTPGATLAEAEDILKITAKAKGEGTARMAVTGITAVAYVKSGDDFDDVKKVDVDIADGKGSVDTVVKKYYDPYDFNRDGTVDILDLTFAQIYYQVSDGDAKWAIVSERGIDIDKNGTVDLADLVNILNHIYNL